MGIYEAFDPVDAPVKPAEAPPVHGFGLDTLAAGWKAGQAGTDWGWHQSNYENDVRDVFQAELKKRGVDAPFVNIAGVRYARRLKAAGIEMPDHMKADVAQADRFWGIVAEQRKLDPKFAADFADVVDEDSLTAKALSRRKNDEDDAGVIYRQSTGLGKAAWWMGNFATGFTDPISYIPVGGGVSKGATVAARILNTAGREALINAGAQVALEPLIRADADLRKEERGIGDVAIDVGFAAGLGGILGATEGGLMEAFSRPKEGRAALDAVVETIGPDKLTPDERAAVHVVTRELDIKEASPFIASPQAAKEHGTRLATALAALEADQPVPDFKATLRSGTSLGTEGDALARFKAAVRTAESGGDDAAKNALSSATGRYQFTDSTWLQYYKRTFPANGLSNEQILAKRSDGAVQDRLMDALTEDNSRLLAAAGQEATAGNLYLIHFLGPRGIKLLKAADDAPVASLLPEEFIRANPSVLEGKTASEVIAWADKKMGGEGIVARRDEDVATLDPALFDDPEAYRLAQMADDDGSNFSFAEGGDQRIAGGSVGFEAPAWRELPESAQLNTPRVPTKTEMETLSRVESVPLAASRRGNKYDWRKNAEGDYGEPLVEGFSDKPVAVRLESGEYIIVDGNHRAALAAGRGDYAMDMYVVDARKFDPENMGRKPAKSTVSDDELLAELRVFYDIGASGEKSPGGQTSRRDPLTPDGGSTGAELGGNIATERLANNEGQSGGAPVAERVVQEVEALGDRFTQPMDADAKAQADSIAHDLAAELLASKATAIDHIPALREYIRDRSLPLSAEAIAKKLGIEVEAARAALGRLASSANSGLVVSKSGKVRRRPVRNGPVDAITLIADAGGMADNEGHSLTKGRNLQRMVPGAGPWIRKGGMSLDEAGELLWEKGYFGPPETQPRPDGAQVLELLERAVDRKVYAPEDVLDASDASRVDAMSEDEARALDEIDTVLDAERVTFDDAARQRALMLMADGATAEDAVFTTMQREIEDINNAIAIETDDEFYDRNFFYEPSDEIAGESAVSADADGEGGGGSARGTGDARARIQDGGESALDLGAAVDPSIADRQRRQVQLGAESPLRKPVEQDGTMGLGLFDAADQPTFRLGDEGPEVTLDDVLRQAEADEAAIAAARNCL